MFTVFGEEIVENDKIMYMYIRNGNMVKSFGKVIRIEIQNDWIHPIERLHVHKTYEMCHEHKKIDKMVILTNPTAFKCGVEIPYLGE